MKNHTDNDTLANIARKIDKSWSFPKIEDKLHSEGREKLVWFSRTGGTRVKCMSNIHIINVKNHIDKKTTDITRAWCGHSKKIWDYVLNKELQYREEIGEDFLNHCRRIFPTSKLFV